MTISPFPRPTSAAPRVVFWAHDFLQWRKEDQKQTCSLPSISGLLPRSPLLSWRTLGQLTDLDHRKAAGTKKGWGSE